MVSHVAHPAVRNFPYNGRLPLGVAYEARATYAGECIFIEYRGSEQDLIACGIVTAALLAKKSNARKLDDKGMKVSINRRRDGQITVGRWRLRGDAHELLGFQPWMVDICRCKEEKAQQQHQEWKRRQAEKERLEFCKTVPALDPETWRQRRVQLLRALGVAVVSAADDCDGAPLQGYRVQETDREAYRTRAQAMIEELVGMVAKLCIVRAPQKGSPLRLVVDNTREVQP